MAKVTRIDRDGSMMTTFCFEDGDRGADIHVPADQADDYETAIVNATWTQLNNIFTRSGETVIKTNE